MPKLTRCERLFAFANEAQRDVVTSPLVRRREPSLEDVQGFLSAGKFSSKAQHIGIVVGSREPTHVSAGTQRCTDARISIGDDTHANPGGADENSPIRLTAQNRLANLG